MKRLLIVILMAMLLVGIVSSYVCIYPATDNEDSIIRIIPINIYQEDSEYSDLYKVECGDKEFYTSYPSRLNFKEICK